jgi:hypothetical protein
VIVDGTVEATATISATYSSDAGGTTLLIGNLSGCTGREYGGAIDSVQIYGRSLTDVELAAL